jgi:hypothetical protein
MLIDLRDGCIGSPKWSLRMVMLAEEHVVIALKAVQVKQKMGMCKNTLLRLKRNNITGKDQVITQRK